MTEQQKKYEKIAVAFFCYFWNQAGTNKNEGFENWLLTEEGKRLTADRICGQTCGCSVPEQCPNIIAKERLSDDTESSEEVKWLRAAMETQFEAYEALEFQYSTGHCNSVWKYGDETGKGQSYVFKCKECKKWFVNHTGSLEYHEIN